MSRAKTYICTILDLLVVGTIGILLILLLYIARRPRVLHPSAVEEIDHDSGNIFASNSVDTIATTPTIEEQALPEATDPEGAVNAMQEEREAEQTQELEAEQTQELEAEQTQELEALIERTEAYCVKCREKREMQNARRIVTKNGRNAMEGTCPICSTRLFRFIAR